MYYLFLKNSTKLKRYKTQLLKTKKNIEQGKTPVFNELASAKINLIESVPFNLINAIFLIFTTLIFNYININEIFKIAALLIMNSVCRNIANFLFVYIKYYLRIQLCKRLNIEPNEENISAMESLEYQSV